MNAFKSITILITIIVVSAGCAYTEEDAAKDKRFHRYQEYRGYDWWAPVPLKGANLQDVTVIKSKGGSHGAYSQGNEYRSIRGPYVIEGQGFRFVNGDRSFLDTHIVYLYPGQYTVTAWVQPVAYTLCETTDLDWVKCIRPPSRKIDMGYTTTPTGEIVRDIRVERVNTKYVFDYIKLTCTMNLPIGEEVHAGMFILGCMALHNPEIDFTDGQEHLQMKPIDSEQISEEDLEAASAMKTRLENLTSGIQP